MRPFSTSRGRRPGTVTVIVVAFLALLLVFGLSFAFYALRESEETRVYRDSVNGGATGVVPVRRTSSGTDQPPEPDTIANITLGNVIYGPPDDLTGAFNVLRTHELARSMYGWNPKWPSPFYPYTGNVINGWPEQYAPNGYPIGQSNAAVQPYNGIGWVSPNQVLTPNLQFPNFPDNTLPPLPPLPDTMVNWTWVPQLWGTGVSLFDPDNNYRRDPRPNAPVPPQEQTPQPFTYNPANPKNPPPKGGYDRYWARNANYTYPDVKDFYLAAIDPTTGRVLIPSYYRPWLLKDSVTGAITPPPDNPVPGQPVQIPVDKNGNAVPQLQSNPWMNIGGRLSMLRPRPIDHQWPPGSGNSEWRYPTVNVNPQTGKPDYANFGAGDVELIEGKAMGRQLDAMWLDLDLPVRMWQGKNYKPLVALLIRDLDGSVNLNTAGNFQVNPQNPTTYVSGSDQGLGPWEVNPGRVMYYLPPPTPMNPNPQPVMRIDEASQLSLGSLPAPGMAAHSKYGQFWNGGVPTRAPVKPFYAYINETAALNNLNMTAQIDRPHFYAGLDYRSVVEPNEGGQYGSNASGHLTNFDFGPGFDGTITPLGVARNNPPRPHVMTNNNQPPSSLYDDGMHVVRANGAVLFDSRVNHASLYNPYLLRSRSSINLNGGAGTTVVGRSFGVDEVRRLTAKYNYDDYTGSHLAALAPSTLGNPEFRTGLPNARYLVTTISNDLNVAGASPWLSRPGATSFQVPQQQQGQLQGQPKSQAPVPLDPRGPVDMTLGPDYDQSFRAQLSAALGSIDINRKLTDYRSNTMQPLSPSNAGNFQRAVADRQLLAHDIFYRLCVATGVMSPAAFTPQPGDATQRWLAQLAVNIVDFIDTDECITPFNWTDPKGANGSNDDLTNEAIANAGNGYQNQNYRTSVAQRWVFGFERPRAVINEAYVRLENDPKDPFPVDQNDGKKKASKPYKMLMWLELHNPLTPANPAEQTTGNEGFQITPVPPVPVADDNTHGMYRATLSDTFGQGGQKSIYRVLVSKIIGQNGNDPMGMLAKNNADGFPQTNVLQNSTNGRPMILEFYQGGNNGVTNAQGNSKNMMVIEPNVGAQYQAQDAFFIAGPAQDSQNGQGAAKAPQGGGKVTTANVTSSNLQADVQFNEFNQGTSQWAPGFIVQRLACPAMPPGPQNPYVTTDYFEGDPRAVNNRIAIDDQGNQFGNNGQPPNWNTTYAWGRRQPYDGVINYGDQGHYRQNPQGGGQNDIKWTFGQHNGSNVAQQSNQWTQQGDATLELPFRPLVHNDRPLIDAAELLHVVAVRPHELTHNFFGAPNQSGLTGDNGLQYKLKYTADWLDQSPVGQSSVLLYRALDLLRVGPNVVGMGVGGRVPGKININTIFSQQVFEAVCDAQASNRFTSNDVTTAWNQLVAARQPSGLGMITQSDRPFRGSAVPVDGSAGYYNPNTTSPGLDRTETLLRPDFLWPSPTTNLAKSQETYTGGPSPNGRAAALQKYEMATKVFNQFTTRSNTFAVYMMIGYFEVKNPGPYNEANRPILGKELGVDEGTVTRHKFFAVVDRTNLSIEDYGSNRVPPGFVPPPPKQGQPPVYFTYEPNVNLPVRQNAYQLIDNPAQPNQATVDPTVVPTVQPQIRIPIVGEPTNPNNNQPIPGMVIGEYDGALWTIQTGVSQLMVDTGPMQEGPFLVTGVAVNNAATPNTAVLQLTRVGAGVPNGPPPGFTLQHARGATIRLLNPDPSQPASIPGNPGPQPGFNYKSPRYAPVVRYVEQLR